jgi:glycosyltransferase involved in cell wall biosynthesis
VTNVVSAATGKPLVGLGMPVFNGERYIVEALQSILDQTYEHLELVICDNASTDRTEEICRDFAARDARVRYYRNPQNIGAHPNYNRAFELSQGKYFKWVPHDDVLRPDYLSACVEALEADPDAVVCQTQLDFIGAAGEPLGVCGTDLLGAQALRPAQRFGSAILTPHNCYEVMGLYRRDVLQQSILLMSFHGADRALIAQLTLYGRFLHVSLPLLGVRDHKERYTRSQVKPKERAAWHDARLKGKLTFPTWRLYAEYWGMLSRAPLTVGQKARSCLLLLQWWFVNWNAARAVVDLLSSFAPGIVGWAERLKQRLFAPAPGIDQLRKGRDRG